MSTSFCCFKPCFYVWKSHYIWHLCCQQFSIFHPLHFGFICGLNTISKAFALRFSFICALVFALDCSSMCLLMFSLDSILGYYQGFQLFLSRLLWKNVNTKEVQWFEVNFLSWMLNHPCSLPYLHTHKILVFSLHNYHWNQLVYHLWI